MGGAHAQAADGVPRRLVQFLASARTRAYIGAGAFVVSVLGAALYYDFSKQLDVVVEPPASSASGVARAKYEQYFHPDPIQVIALLSSRSGAPLVNVTEMQRRSKEGCPYAPRELPGVNVTLPCPLKMNDTRTALSDAAAHVSHALNAKTQALSSSGGGGECVVSFSSYWDFGLDASPGHPLDTAATELLEWLGEGELFNSNGSATLLVAQVTSCRGQYLDPVCVTQGKPWCTPVMDLGDAFRAYAKQHSTYDSDALQLQVVSFPDVYVAVQDGVYTTMFVSTLSSPLAFALLGYMLKNVRLLLIPLLNIFTCAFATTCVMYVVSKHAQVSAEAPALMVAVALAMSIDYSLFLLTRFQEELHARGALYEDAIVTMLATSGHTVLVSGLTLTICFLAMLLIPVTTISTMGISAACTVVFAIVLALTLTPTMLLSFPYFFASNRRLGLTLDAVSKPTCCRRKHERLDAARGGGATAVLNGSVALGHTAVPPTRLTAAQLNQAALAPPFDAPPTPATATADGAFPGAQRSSTRSDTASLCDAGPGERLRGLEASSTQRCPKSTAADAVDVAHARAAAAARRSGWARLGAWAQTGWVAPILLLLAFGAAAVPFAIPLTRMSYVEGVTPLLPRTGDTTAAFDRLQQLFGVSLVFPTQIVLVPPSRENMTEARWLAASCQALKYVAGNVTETLAQEGVHYVMRDEDFSAVFMQRGLCIGWLTAALEWSSSPNKAKDLGDTLLALFGNAEHTATKVSVTTTLDPFSDDGQAWISAVRRAIAEQHTVLGTAVGDMYFTGMAPEQMDGSRYTFDSLPRVIVATLLIVCAVFLVAFRSLFVPLRAVLCLVWMLVVSFGSATAVYQGAGALHALGWANFAPTSGAVFWMSPCIAFSMVVGLGLDYDVFFMESVVEYYDEGDTPKQAVARALASTGNIICVAGIIMSLAFGALLLGDTAALNQIGFLLIVGVLVDCFVTTKLIIPMAMALVPAQWNFWPRKPPLPQPHGGLDPTSPLLGEQRGSLTSGGAQDARYSIN